MSYGFANCNDEYRNGGEMNETEPYIPDTVDWFNRARQDWRVIKNQLALMQMPREDQEQ